MIDLYYHTSPNARKVLMALEELALPYRLCWTDITGGAQFEPGFQAISPNGRIPAIVDPQGPDDQPIAMFESCAILEYLAEKAGRLLPRDAAGRHEMRAWLVWQAANQGPACGQAAHFVSHAPARGIVADYAMQRFRGEAERVYGVMQRRLATREWLVGDAMSVADIACFPWTRVAKGHGVALSDFPAVQAWSDRIAGRPSAQVKPGPPGQQGSPAYRAYDDRQWAVLFGASAR